MRSQRSRIVNAQAGYHLTNGWRLAFEVFNLLNSDASDIDYYYYYYASRLPGEPLDAVLDIHTHPVAQRMARVASAVRVLRRMFAPTSGQGSPMSAQILKPPEIRTKDA